MKLIISEHECFVNNKYANWYENIINKRLESPYIGKGEYHHFIPKSIMKNDNTVFLSLREHYICHLLLCKCVKQEYKKKMLYAITAMKIKTLQGTNFNSHLFEFLKNKANEHRSASKKGIPRSDETKAKLRQANLGKKATDETKSKMSQKAKGRKKTQEQIEKTRIAHIGTKRTSESKQKMSCAHNMREPLICPWCGKSSNNYSNMYRWHFGNCKMSPHDVDHSNPNIRGANNPASKRVVINGITFDSVNDAASYIGRNPHTIILYLKGKRNLNDFIWEAYYLPALGTTS